jgi:hypothetical protein
MFSCVSIIGSGVIVGGGAKFLSEYTFNGPRGLTDLAMYMDFKAPTFSVGFTFGCCAALIHVIAKKIFETCMHTRNESGSCMGGHWSYIKTDNPTAYKLSSYLNPIISTIAASLCLNSMNYLIAPQFVAICTIPFFLCPIDDGVVKND